MSDPKFQGHVLADQIRVGEMLAQASLAAECLVLRVSEVEPVLQYKYTGRSQYPRIADRPLVARDFKEDEKVACPRPVFWARLLSILQTLKQALFSDGSDSLLAVCVDKLHVFKSAFNDFLPDEEHIMVLDVHGVTSKLSSVAELSLAAISLVISKVVGIRDHFAR